MCRREVKRYVVVFVLVLSIEDTYVLVYQKNSSTTLKSLKLIF